VDAGTGRTVRAGDDDITRNVRISVEEILSGVWADFGFPMYSTRAEFERTEEAIARADEHEVAYDRRRVRKSTASFKVPQGRSRTGLLLGARAVPQWTEKNNQHEPR
jgi:hypothetical protein